MTKASNPLKPVVLKKDAPTYYTLRYVPGVEMHRRTHEETMVQRTTWIDAELERLTLPDDKVDELEVVKR
jgi:hypothetical protein